MPQAWVLESQPAQVKNGSSYMVLVVVPSDWTVVQTSDFLAQQGWLSTVDGGTLIFYNVPPSYQAYLDTLTKQGEAAPNAWFVVGKWNGADGALPANVGVLYYGPAYVLQITPDQPSTSPPVVPAAQSTTWPIVLGLTAGILVFGGAWLALKRKPSTGYAMEATGVHPLAVYGKLRLIADGDVREIIWWQSRMNYTPLVRFEGDRQRMFYTSQATFRVLRQMHPENAFEDLDRARRLVSRASEAANIEWRNYANSIGFFGQQEAIARYELAVMSRLSKSAAETTTHRYEVVVGNVGTVYDGSSLSEARKTYDEYVRLSQDHRSGRAYGEDVTLLSNGEPIREYHGGDITRIHVDRAG